jgi:hypothetical protein
LDVHGESEVTSELVLALAALFNELEADNDTVNEGRTEDCELEEPTLEGRKGPKSWEE